jgi:hypothetical protein
VAQVRHLCCGDHTSWENAHDAGILVEAAYRRFIVRAGETTYMTSVAFSVARYRARAHEIRGLAQACIDAAIKAALLKIAEEYDQLAASCEITGIGRTLLSEHTAH